MEGDKNNIKGEPVRVKIRDNIITQRVYQKHKCQRKIRKDIDKFKRKTRT